jgi:hypothetical protein
MDERLNDYNWASAFEYADPISVPPGSSGPHEDAFTREEVSEIVWIEEGENEGPDWLVGGRLRDGRWFFLAAGCDYTGWDCQAGGNAYVADSREEIERFGMGDEDRRRLGVVLPDDAERRVQNAGW